MEYKSNFPRCMKSRIFGLFSIELELRLCCLSANNTSSHAETMGEGPTIGVIPALPDTKNTGLPGVLMNHHSGHGEVRNLDLSDVPAVLIDHMVVMLVK